MAGVAGLVRLAAAAGIHRRDELEARGIDDAVIGARDRDFADLDRLAQAVERLRLEFRQFVEKQHAVMGERDFAGLGVDAAADQRRHRGRMMRRAERPPVGQARRRRARPATEWTIDTSSSSRGLSGGRIEGRRCASIDLPAPGRAAHQEIVPAGGGDLERALGALLALDVAKVGLRPAGRAHGRLGPAQAPAFP